MKTMPIVWIYFVKTFNHKIGSVPKTLLACTWIYKLSVLSVKLDFSPAMLWL